MGIVNIDVHSGHDDVGPSLEKTGRHPLQHTWVDPIIPVNQRDQFTAGDVQTRVPSGRKTAIDSVDHPDAMVPCCIAVGDLASAVGCAVVNDDDLEVLLSLDYKGVQAAGQEPFDIVADMPAYLIVVGQGELRPELELEIKQLGIADRVHLIGARKDIPQVMKTLDYMVLPSLYEGLPVVLVEAQAAGLPSLVSDQVTPEIDLGLDLVERLPLDLDAWVKRLQAPRPRVPSREHITSALEAAGYMAETSAAKLLKVYGLEP